jgi:short-subunit dehydrogenase
MKLHLKTIWITGASSGIGEALAHELAKRQNTLLLSGRNMDRLEKIKKQLSTYNSTIELFPFDLSKPEEIENTADQVLKKHPGIDLLVNNGGISQRSRVDETTVEVDRKIMEINYFGNIILTKRVLPLMIRNGGGHIATTSSIVGKFGFPLRSAYSASKHALYGFYETLRSESYSQNIKVTIICPGRIHTNISYNALDKEGKEQGVLDKGQEHGMSAEKSAKKIVKKLEKEKSEILVGGKELLMVHIKRFLPRLFFLLARKINPT